MKTLDEVIKALQIHVVDIDAGCEECSYFRTKGCGNELYHDVLRFLRVLKEMQEDRNKEILARDEERQRENKAPILQVPEQVLPDVGKRQESEPEKPLPWEDPWRKAPEVELPADWIRVENTAINPANVLYVIYQDERTTVIMHGDRKLETPGNPFGLEG